MSIVVPALNEEAYIATCLQSLVAQAEAACAEVMVLDGGSTDRTRQIVRGIAMLHPCVRLIDNPRRTQAAAMNLAARLSEASVLVRADAHAAYPADFVERVVAALQAHGASSVVVPMTTAVAPDGGGFQAAVAAAQNSRLGNGGSAHRGRPASGWVEHGHHAAFDRSFLLRIGGYDEGFTHNEDAELDFRASAAGGRIWMCAEAPVIYYPRADLLSLARQYYRHGRGRARMLRKHGLWPRPRQVAPVLVTLAVLPPLLASPMYPLLAVPMMLYAGLCIAWGAVAAWPYRQYWAAAGGVAAIAMHLGWGCGFLVGTAQALALPPQAGDAAVAAG